MDNIQKVKIKFIAPLLPPVTGQSLACRALLDNLIKTHPVELLSLSEDGFKQGFSSIGRLFYISLILFRLMRIRAAKVIYFTLAESRSGSLKDILIYTLCWPDISRMVIHLHGGAGMRILLSDNHPMIYRLNKFFLKRVGAVVVLGDRLKSIYEGIMPLSRLHVVHNFADDCVAH